ESTQENPDQTIGSKFNNSPDHLDFGLYCKRLQKSETKCAFQNSSSQSEPILCALSFLFAPLRERFMFQAQAQRTVSMFLLAHLVYLKAASEL
ncbi:MAG TPA: hypothetical protein VGN95_06050, partial [Pyrinomonadaceae bacterium]|nr:hypothetical protein [Pyrinomonadaceae bacterium]